MGSYAGGPDPSSGDMHPNQQELMDRISSFLGEVENLTPGKALEARLNADYGPGNAYYEDFCRLIKLGIAEGWAANIPIDPETNGPTKYRRSRLSLPTEATRFCSVTTVYMRADGEDDVPAATGPGAAPPSFRGQYHAHPYGEINCVVPIDAGAELRGLQGWQGAGWTSPHPGSHHYPEARGGALVALFFLPAGRICYDARPGDPMVAVS